MSENTEEKKVTEAVTEETAEVKETVKDVTVKSEVKKTEDRRHYRCCDRSSRNALFHLHRKLQFLGKSLAREVRSDPRLFLYGLSEERLYAGAHRDRLLLEGIL